VVTGVSVDARGPPPPWPWCPMPSRCVLVFFVRVCVPVMGLVESWVVTFVAWRPRRRDTRPGLVVEVEVVVV